MKISEFTAKFKKARAALCKDDSGVTPHIQVDIIAALAVLSGVDLEDDAAASEQPWKTE